jgi:hypothetical protein
MDNVSFNTSGLMMAIQGAVLKKAVSTSPEIVLSILDAIDVQQSKDMKEEIAQLVGKGQMLDVRA